VVGGGISGIACARVVAKGGLPVVVLDRGRRLGGRMAVRTVEGRAVDTGASYFTVSDGRFEKVVRDWEARGLARPWTDTFEVIEGGEGGERAKPPVTTSGSMRWAAPEGLRGLVEDLAVGLDTEQLAVGAVTRPGGRLRVDGRPASVVVLAMPDPQARRLLDDTLTSGAELDDGFAPTLALMAGWDERTWGAATDGEKVTAASAFDGAFVNGDSALTWIADDGRRRGDGAPVLVAHSTVDLARTHLEDPAAAGPDMLAALMRLLVIEAPPRWTHVHRWSFAHPSGTRTRTHHLGDDGVGLCGDGWAERPRVEAAYLSGHDLGDAVVARLSA
ncbi:MAG: NAD(P)-binding protein, partial [Humibacillus sp.]